MWAELGELILSAGAVYIIAALCAKLAKKSAALEESERRALENEKVDKIISANAVLSRHVCIERLRGDENQK